MSLKGTLSYIKNFIADKDVAAIAPASRFLVQRVCQWIDFSESVTVVEYGPGNGVFSEYILERMDDESTLLMIETNANFVDTLNRRWGDDPRAIVVQNQAQNVEDIMDEHGIAQADYVLSGIPFSFLDSDVKDDLLVSTREVLDEDGKFLVYQNYNHMEKPLRSHFSTVTKQYELLNIPPMFAYEATKE